jgi:hypothetical protein
MSLRRRSLAPTPLPSKSRRHSIQPLIQPSPSSSLPHTPLLSPSNTHILDPHPRHRHDNIHALVQRALPLEAVGAVALVIPERADGAVHAAAAVLLGLRGHADVLDDGAVGNVFVGGLRGLRGGGGGGGG